MDKLTREIKEQLQKVANGEITVEYANALLQNMIENHTVRFGNYLLSRERRKARTRKLRDMVHRSDLEEFNMQQGE